jgi:hypothetical protein
MTWGFYFDVERQEKFSFENTIFLNELTDEEKVAILTNDETTRPQTTTKQKYKNQEQIDELIKKNITVPPDNRYIENTIFKIVACIYLIYIIY